MKVTARREIKAMSVCKLDRARQSKYRTRTMKRDSHTAMVVFADYAEPNREFSALWKSYDDLSRAATASSLPKPIPVNCFTASTSSLSPKVFSWGGIRCEPRAGIGGGFWLSCDFFFFPNGSRICFKRIHVQKID